LRLGLGLINFLAPVYQSCRAGIRSTRNVIQVPVSVNYLSGCNAGFSSILWRFDTVKSFALNQQDSIAASILAPRLMSNFSQKAGWISEIYGNDSSETIASIEFQR